MQYTVMARRHQSTSTKQGRDKSADWMPPTEYRSSADLPQFTVQATHAREALYLAGWILDTRRDPTTTHTYTITDGNGHVWDETGKEL